MNTKKTALIILDGFGINNLNLAENAIYQAKTPTFDRLFQNSYSELGSSGEIVGLPEGQIGNSEVGHLTIGAGRVNYQSIVKISKMFNDGEFEKIKEFQLGIEYAKQNNSTIHLFQLFGPGGVHGLDQHLESIIKIIPTDIKINIHLFADGRDISPDSAFELAEGFEEYISGFSNVSISSIGGRYYGMDRDNNWERIFKSYEQITAGTNKTELSLSEYIKKSYSEKIYDEFIEPAKFEKGDIVKDNDVLFFLNFRSDRAKQMVQAFEQEDFDGFATKKLKNLFISTMTAYYPEYKANIFIKNEDLINTLPEVISKKGLTQLHLAETEKFAHVTKFFAGGRQEIFPGEKQILIPSHKVVTYDLDPKMSAGEIKDKYMQEANKYDFSVINFANGDMVGHTGKMPAVIEAIEELDACIKELIEFSKQNNISFIITADHGNCEEMGNNNSPKTAHSTAPVPCWYLSAGEVKKIAKTGGLADIAPTILDIMGIEKPDEMTGKSLI